MNNAFINNYVQNPEAFSFELYKFHNFTVLQLHVMLTSLVCQIVYRYRQYTHTTYLNNMNIYIYLLLKNYVKLLKCFQLLTPGTPSPRSATALHLIFGAYSLEFYLQLFFSTGIHTMQ